MFDLQLNWLIFARLETNSNTVPSSFFPLISTLWSQSYIFLSFFYEIASKWTNTLTHSVVFVLCEKKNKKHSGFRLSSFHQFRPWVQCTVKQRQKKQGQKIPRRIPRQLNRNDKNIEILLQGTAGEEQNSHPYQSRIRGKITYLFCPITALISVSSQLVYEVHPKSNWKMWIKREWLQLEG